MSTGYSSGYDVKVSNSGEKFKMETQPGRLYTNSYQK